MSPLENIVDAIHALSDDDKLRLRLLLDAELQAASKPSPPTQNGSHPGKRILGLFADEPELMDRVMESVYESRSRPMRLST